MRSIKESLEVLRDELEYQKNNPHNTCSGLCSTMEVLCLRKNMFTFIEYTWLKKYVDNNLPVRRHAGYAWLPYKLTYRLKWVNKHIKLNS